MGVKSLWQSLKDFDPEKEIFELLSFKLIFWGFSIAAIGSALIIMVHATDLPFDWSYVGFNRFALIYKIPIGIVTFMLAIIALIATNHRSSQTRRQIELSHSQNLFTNYYKHLEEFEKRHREMFSKQIQDPDEAVHNLHNLLFPKARAGYYSVPVEVLQYIDNAITGCLIGLGESNEVKDIY